MSTSVPPGPAPPPPAPPAVPVPGPSPRVLRRRTGTVVAGVAGGVADHLDVPVLRVRLAFALLAALGGAGFLAYGALWVLCPPEPPGHPRVTDPRERRQGFGLAALGIGVALVVSAMGEQPSAWMAGPLGLALVGAAVVWREADDGSAGAGPVRRWRRGPWPGLVGGRGGVLRVLAGAVLVAGGITVFLFGQLDLGQVPFALLAALATLVGVVVLTVPWWVRLGRELTAERRERIRGQERADIAAHLHDSVLQTLALIQRHTEDGAEGGTDPAEAVREVRRLARRQERELRTWLYGAGDPAEPTAAPATFGAALAAAAGEVEDDHAVTVAPVLVGDTVLDESSAALAAAAREAMVNAAKHAGVAEVDVYAEVEDDAVSVFVRDRGRGFDPDDVPDDRHGLADSVRARTERHGGTVRVRSTPGSGTEVELRLPLRAHDEPAEPAATPPAEPAATPPAEPAATPPAAGPAATPPATRRPAELPAGVRADRPSDRPSDRASDEPTRETSDVTFPRTRETR